MVPPQPPRKQSSAVLIAVIVLILLALVGAGVAVALSRGSGSGAVSTQPTATATTAPSPTPSIPAGFTQFAGPSNAYSLDVPSDWAKTDSSQGAVRIIVFNNGQGGAFEIESFPSGGISGRQLDDRYLGAISGTVANKQGPTTVQQAGESWTQESGDVQLNGTPFHVVVKNTIHGGNTYIVAYLAPASAFDSVNTQDFQLMFTSLQFLS